MISYAHHTNGTVDAFGPPRLAWDGSRWWDLRPLDPNVLAALDWLPVVEAQRPADTATDTYESTYTVDGATVVQSWTPRPWTAEELAARAEGTREQTLTDTLRAGIAAAVRRRQQLDAAADALAVDLAALSALNLAAFKALGNRVVSLARATALGQRDTIALARLVARALDTDTT